MQGTVIRIHAVFTSERTGDPVEPGEVVARIDKPGVEQTVELKLSEDEVKDDPDVAGGYFADIDTTDGPPGTWIYQFESVGATKVTNRKALTIRSRV